MELIVLGGSGSYPTPRSQCSGYLLREGEHTLWLDAGNGTLAGLQEHVSFEDLSGVFLSHAHPDHCADMYPFFFAMLFAGLPPKPVFTPPGLADRLAALIGEDSQDAWRSMMAWRELDYGATTELGPFRLETFEAAHSARNNSVRIESGGKVLCYSGDTGPNPHLARAARDADLFLCESSWTNDQRGFMGPIHLAAGEAGEAARDAGCARLMLTHVWPTNDAGIVREQAAEVFAGEVSIAIEERGANV